MRVTVLIIDGVQSGRILDHIGVPAQAPSYRPGTRAIVVGRLRSAGRRRCRGGAMIEPDWGQSAQTEPDLEVDQRTNR